MSDNIYEKPNSELNVQPPVDLKDALFEAEHHKLKGLGGWLILVGFGVVISPVRLVFVTGSAFFPIFNDGTWGLLTDTGSEFYIPYIGAFLITEITFNTAMVLASFYLIYLYFTKHYLFPKFYIAIVAASVIFILLDAWVGTLFFPDDPMLDPDTSREFGRALFGGLVWIPYMLLSKRVKVTFVEHRPT